jgi:hypothetical protein
MPDIPAVQSAGGSTAITVHSGDVNIQGDANATTIALMRQELAKRDAELPSKVVQAVTLAKKRRQLA